MPTAPALHLHLPDGTTWPRPALERDDINSAAWKAVHAPESLTRADILWLASAADAYGHLVVGTTAKGRNEAIAQIRQLLDAEVTA